MAKRQFITDIHKAWLRDNYPKLGIEDLTLAFNAAFGFDKTPGQMKSTLSNHKILCGRGQGALNKGRFTLLSGAQIAFLRKHYKTTELKGVVTEMNAEFNTDITLKQLRAFTRNHEIRSNRCTQFKPNHLPHNAGTKGVVKPNSGSFKKGRPSLNQVSIGSERINVDGYVEIKVADPNKWDLKQRVVWRLHNGDIPTGEMVRFKDGDRKNTDIDNLFIVNRSTNAILNNRYKLNDQPLELKNSIILMAKIDSRLGELI